MPMPVSSKKWTVHDSLSVLSFLVFASSFFISFTAGYSLVIAAAFLAIGISSAVHNAKVIAHRVGPSFGTLILALSVTIIEVALIVSLMGNNDSNSPTIARDTVFATIMIVTNGVIGFCIWVGGLKRKEIGFQWMGTSSLLGVLAVLTTVTLVLPNFTISTTGPTYGPSQLIFVSVASVFLYGALIWAQTVSHKSYFESSPDDVSTEAPHSRPSMARAALSFGALLLSLFAVVGLSKILSPTIESLIITMGAPRAVVGIVVSILVLAPETLAALNAAKTNQLQTSLNLALGSGAASIALTIPAVSIYSLVFNKPLALGLDPKSMVFILLTFMAGSFTFGAGRTTALHGLVHLVILASYLAMAFMP